MESGGNEKRIQALFSELRLETQNSAPAFESLWPRTTVIKRTEVRRPMALLIAFSMIAVACAFVFWSWYNSSASSPAQIADQPPQQAVPVIADLAPVSPAVKPQPARKRNIHRRKIERSNMAEVAMLSSWQSPTQLFMESPTELALLQLPQLNQSVNDLETFLSQDKELMKESNR